MYGMNVSVPLLQVPEPRSMDVPRALCAHERCYCCRRGSYRSSTMVLRVWVILVQAKTISRWC